MRAGLLLLLAAVCLGAHQAAAFLGATTPLRTATLTKKSNPFQRQSVVLKPTLIINHSSGESMDQAKKEALILEASQIVAKTLGKPESYVLVSLTEATMSFGGKVGPTAFLYLVRDDFRLRLSGVGNDAIHPLTHPLALHRKHPKQTSIGHIGSDTNPEAAKALTELVSANLNIPKNRIFIQFVDSAAANFGWQGNTFG